MRQFVIMPGGFHPFHAGHYALYKSALDVFPDADVYVAATNDTKTRPFPFEIKEKLAKVAGVKDGRFVQVKSPFKPDEILQNYDPEEDTVIFVRSEKDRDQQPKPGGTKKDGSPAYFQPYTGKDMQPFGKHGYMAYLPTVEFGPGIKSATEIRNVWPQLDDRRKLAMVMSLYPKTIDNQKLAQNIVGMLDVGMGTQEVSESRQVDEASGRMSSARNANITYDLGNGYFLGDDSYDDPDGFVKEGYSVYYQEDQDQYRLVGEVKMSPYSNPPGHVESQISKLIAADQTNLTESVFDWSDYRFVENMDTRMDIVAAHFTSKMNLTESNEPDMVSYFTSLAKMSDNVAINKKCILVPLVLVNNKVSQVQFPEVVKLLKVDNGIYTVERSSGIVDTYPKTNDRGKVSFITMMFNKLSSYNKFRSAVMLKFESSLPNPDLFMNARVNTQKSNKLDESQDYLDEK